VGYPAGSASILILCSQIVSTECLDKSGLPFACSNSRN
jgi:hypothetical protein